MTAGANRNKRRGKVAQMLELRAASRTAPNPKGRGIAGSGRLGVRSPPVPGRFVRAFVLGLALAASFGCERMREVKRCRALAQKVNPALDRIEARDAAGKTRASYDLIAYEYNTIAAGLDDFDGGTPELDRAVADYAALARTSARQSVALAEALGSRNAASAALATRELERLARQEKVLVLRIDEECRPK